MIQRLQAALRALIDPPQDLQFDYKEVEELKEGDVVLAYLRVRGRKKYFDTSQTDHVILVPEQADSLNSRMLQVGDQYLWTWGNTQKNSQPFMVRRDS